MNCKKCGSYVPSDAKVCQNCGLSNPAPHWKQTEVTAQSVSRQSTKPAPTANKKKFPLWIIFAIVAAIVLIFVAKSSGTSSLEKDLISTLPVDMLSYVLHEDSSVHVLEVKDLIIERHSEDGNYDVADCIVKLEDDYMKMTAYVTLNSTKYDTGWVVKSWTETKEPEVVAKYEPDKQLLQSYAKNTYYKNYTTLRDELDMESGLYNYVCSVNDTYKYISYSGTISLTSKFEKIGYDRVEELNEYGWSCWNHSIVEDIDVQWDIFGEWRVEEHFNILTDYWVLNIQSLNGEAVLDGNTQIWHGDYNGYNVRSYRAWDYSKNDYADVFENEDVNHNGSYNITNLYNPAEVKMVIYGPSGYAVEIYADNAIGYSDYDDDSIFSNNSQEGILTFKKY